MWSANLLPLRRGIVIWCYCVSVSLFYLSSIVAINEGPSAHRNNARLRHSRHLDKAAFHSDGRADEYNGGGISYSTFPTGGSPVGTRLIVHDNHKPVFTNCSNYHPTVKEEQPAGVFVLKVTAIDKDPIDNGGNITYTFVSNPGERMKFYINPSTGEITTNNHVFDRDEPSREKEVYLTVRATDNGRPQLDDVCTVKVTIEDINDNIPFFDKVNYQESMPQDTQVGKEVMRISATDIDDGNNSIVLYNLEAKVREEEKYFHIDKHTGSIYLDKTIDKDPGYKFRFKATATDQGANPTPAYTDIELTVVESNKKPPSFTYIPSSPIVIKENLTDYNYNIATLTAVSHTDEAAPVFELVKGRTEQTNKESTFRLVPEGTTAHIRLGQSLNYENINEYTLTIRIQNKYKLAAETSLTIQLEDVNDNYPMFIEIASGSVYENEPPGTPVMQVRAIDYDSSLEHNQVTYELSDNMEFFEIDKYTGNITTKVTFDREKQDFYNVAVVATDSSPSARYNTGEHNKAEQVFRIEIADKNDHPPHFTQEVYVAEAIPEDANINSLVTEIRAEDNDTASSVDYFIIDGNIDGAFMIEQKTGKIRVNKTLDYENITNYTIRVRAFDGVFEDYCKVIIKIENVNDNGPVFVNFQDKFTIQEEQLIPGCIVKFEAYDPDIPDRSLPQHIAYHVVKQDQQNFLSIDKDGCLSLTKPLDRDPPDGYDRWQVFIAANDEDNGGPTSIQKVEEVIITLIDINDNAPFLDMPRPVIWRENQPPGTITKLTAKDNDGPENGGPFLFSIASSADPEIKEKFGVEGDQLSALVTFDREEKKVYKIPISITDSGSPPQTGTSTLTVIIGDVNDNPMKPGKSSIFVYNYKGEAPDTEIGRVYVDDPDDWDINDKTFNWLHEHHQYFDLNSQTGMITMLNGVEEKSYLLKFEVVEVNSPLIPRHSVEAEVNVTIKVIPEEAVDKSGSIRFSGITAEDFVSPNSDGISKQYLLKKYLAKYLNTSIENVDVFTVLHSPHYTNPIDLDVRFSAHGSPYYAPEKINAAIVKNQIELEKILNAKIQMVNINECMKEKNFCPTDCTNFLNKSNIPSPVYTNTTSFVGVRAIVDPLCNCHVTKKIICYNGGTPVGDTCECREGFEGPNCEILGIGFWGNGWALYPSLSSCLDSHLSLQLRSNKPDGLVFYIGPTTNSQALQVQDFMSLELRAGYPLLLVDFGTGTARVEQKQIKLTDGEFHRIDIIWNNASIELQVDNCKRQNCLTLATPIGKNKFLNVNGPLQVGGAFVDLAYVASGMNWTHKPLPLGFDGCIKNLTFNNKLYNLGMPSLSENADVGCNRITAIAVTFGIDTSFIVAIFVCLLVLLLLLLAVVVHRRKTDDLYKDTDDIRENIINYEDEGGGEGDMEVYDLSVLRLVGPYEGPISEKQNPNGNHLGMRPGSDEVPDINGFLDGKKQVVDNDPETNPFDDVRHYAYEGDGNTTGSLSSLASGTDEADLNFDYLSNFGPRFRKLADMYGEDPSDDDDNYNTPSVSWC